MTVSSGIAASAFAIGGYLRLKSLSLRGRSGPHGVRLLITGAHGFQREVTFAMDEEPAVITERVRATLDE
jgi:hypothetical protein